MCRVRLWNPVASLSFYNPSESKPLDSLMISNFSQTLDSVFTEKFFVWVQVMLLVASDQCSSPGVPSISPWALFFHTAEH